MRNELAKIERGVRAAASTTSDIGREIYTERLYRQLMAPLTDFDQALARIQSGQGAGRYLRDTAQHDSLLASVQSARKSIADLRASKFVQSDEFYTGIDRWVASLARSVDELNYGPMFGAPQSYESMTGFARELESTMRDFRENPRKYLRIKVF